MSQSLITVGIDVGSSAVKVAAMEHRQRQRFKVLGLECQRIRRRDPRSVISGLPIKATLETARLIDEAMTSSTSPPPVKVTSSTSAADTFTE